MFCLTCRWTSRFGTSVSACLIEWHVHICKLTKAVQHKVPSIACTHCLVLCVAQLMSACKLSCTPVCNTEQCTAAANHSHRYNSICLCCRVERYDFLTHKSASLVPFCTIGNPLSGTPPGYVQTRHRLHDKLQAPCRLAVL